MSLKHSYSHSQLMGNNNDVADVMTCERYYTNGDIGRTLSVNGVMLNANEKAIPCGNLPMTFPWGTFTVWSVANNSELAVDTSNIVSPIQQNFRNVDLSKQWLDFTDPRFVNWMDISPSK
jgi:ABC-type Fe3+ transport system substrate-binding protein